MKSIANAEGWISIDSILNFRRMEALFAKKYDIVALAPYALEWEIDIHNSNIRKKDRSVNSRLTVLGFDIE